MPSKFEAAITEFEKLEAGLDHHGEKLLGRMSSTARRLDHVVKKAHQRLDAKDKHISAMDATIDRFDKVLGGNAPPADADERPTPDSSTESSAGSNGSQPSSSSSHPTDRRQGDTWRNGQG